MFREVGLLFLSFSTSGKDLCSVTLLLQKSSTRDHVITAKDHMITVLGSCDRCTWIM